VGIIAESSDSPIVGYSWSIGEVPDDVLDTVDEGFSVGSLSQGTSTLNVKAIAENGDLSPVKTFDFYIDTVSDVISSIMVFDEPGGTPIADGVPQPDNEVFASWTYLTGTSPVLGYSYAINGIPDGSVETIVPSASLGPLDPGLSSLAVRAIDEAGNLGAVSFFNIVVDSQAVAEPSVLVLFGLGLAVMGYQRRNRLAA
jgi:hypothetical protein